MACPGVGPPVARLPMTQSQQSIDDQQSSQFGTAQQAQSGTAGQLYPTRNSLPQDVRTASIAALNKCLADVVVLQSQLKAAHWNVKGPNFYQLHELFEDIAEMLADYTDEIAERVTALGGQAQGTVRVAAQNATIPAFPPTMSDSQAMLNAVASSLATFDTTLYQNLQQVSEQGDLDTADLLNEVSREVSKSLWFVEAHLQQGQTGGQQQQSAGVQQQQQIQQ